MPDTRKGIIHCCIDRETYQMLLDHCAKTGQTKTMAIKRALQAYCEACEKETDDDGRGDLPV